MRDNKSIEHHDKQVGRILTRREVLKLFAASPFMLMLSGYTGSAFALSDGQGSVTGSCIVRPQLTEGPFYVDINTIRSDIREDRKGVLLEINFKVQRISKNTCSALKDALVDVWHADANGNYSGVGNLSNDKFLRGIQSTDGDGNASFTTIYPGWYYGRTPHIHFKVRSSETSNSAYEFTSQLFFEDGISEKVYKRAPYNSRGIINMPNSSDYIYRRGGQDMLLAVSETDRGYKASFNIAVYLD